MDERLKKLPYFELAAVSQILGIDQEYAKALLSRLVRRDEVIRLKRGVYMPREFYLRNIDKPDLMRIVASAIEPESYLTSHWVLQNAGVLSEASYVVSSATWQHGGEVENKLGRFVYTHIKRELFGHYHTDYVMGVEVREATLAKALFDLIYSRSGSWSYKRKGYDLAEDLRLNLDDWKMSDREEFADIVNESKIVKMKYALDNLQRNIWR